MEEQNKWQVGEDEFQSIPILYLGNKRIEILHSFDRNENDDILLAQKICNLLNNELHDDLIVFTIANV